MELLPDAIVGPILDRVASIALHVESRQHGRAHAQQRESALVRGIDELFGGGCDRRKNADPAERIFALVAHEMSRRNGIARDAVEAIASRDEVALELHLLAVYRVTQPRRGGADVVHARVLHLEVQSRACGDARGDQVLDDLLLPVHGDRASARELIERDAVIGALEAQRNPAMHQPFAIEALAEPRLAHELDGALLEHTRAHALLDVLSAATLDDHG